MTTPAYVYAARLLRVVDADTFVIDLDLGLRVHAHATIRLRGIDTPERSTDAGRSAAAFVTARLTGEPLIVQTYKDQQSFARWIADVWVGGIHVAELLRAAGHEA